MVDFQIVFDDFKHYFGEDLTDTDRNISVAINQARSTIDGLKLGNYDYNREIYEPSRLAESLFNYAAHKLTVNKTIRAAKETTAESIGQKSAAYAETQGSNVEKSLSTTRYGQRYLELTKRARILGASIC
jgi:hypothetical protein